MPHALPVLILVVASLALLAPGAVRAAEGTEAAAEPVQETPADGSQVAGAAPAAGEEEAAEDEEEKGEKEDEKEEKVPRDVRIAREHHEQWLQYAPKYADEKLSAYVDGVGQRLAARSDWAEIDYFFGLEQAEGPNAYTPGGGFVYIHTGILPLLQNEAQLAFVLGHEIGHITERHIAKSQRGQMLTNLLSQVVGMVTGQYVAADLSRMAGDIIEKGWGRGYELDADRVGAELLARTGYDTSEAYGGLAVLADYSRFAQEVKLAKPYHGVYSNHPREDKRLQEVLQTAVLQEGNPPNADKGTERFLKVIEGLPYGNPPIAGGTVREGIYYNAPMDITFRVPLNWSMSARGGSIMMQPRLARDEAVLLYRTEPQGRASSPQEFLRRKLRNIQRGQPLEARGMSGFTALYNRNGKKTGLDRRVAVFFNKGQALVFNGEVDDPADLAQYDAQFMRTIRSFRLLNDAERRYTEPTKVALWRADGHTTYADLARYSPLGRHAEEELRLLNADYPEGEPAKGRLIKIIQ